jgi:hypothetical protein
VRLKVVNEIPSTAWSKAGDGCAERVTLSSTLLASAIQALDVTLAFAVGLLALDTAIVGTGVAIIALHPTMPWTFWLPLALALVVSFVLSLATSIANYDFRWRDKAMQAATKAESCAETVELLLTAAQRCSDDAWIQRQILGHAAIILPIGAVGTAISLIPPIAGLWTSLLYCALMTLFLVGIVYEFRAEFKRLWEQMWY